MESPRIGTGTVILEPPRGRQATAPRSFEEAMKGGVQTLLRSAEIATGAMGAPALSAAVRGMRQSATLALPQPGLPAGYPPLLPGASAGVGLPAGGSDPATAVAGSGDTARAAIQNLHA